MKAFWYVLLFAACAAYMIADSVKKMNRTAYREGFYDGGQAAFHALHFDGYTAGVETISTDPNNKRIEIKYKPGMEPK